MIRTNKIGSACITASPNSRAAQWSGYGTSRGRLNLRPVNNRVGVLWTLVYSRFESITNSRRSSGYRLSHSVLRFFFGLIDRFCICLVTAVLLDAGRDGSISGHVVRYQHDLPYHYSWKEPLLSSKRRESMERRKILFAEWWPRRSYALTTWSSNAC
jgi:hypothetical protein